MNRTAQPVYIFFLIALLILMLLSSCSSSEETPILTAAPPTRPATQTPTPDATATSEANYQATLESNMTQNAAHAATGEAMLTESSAAQPPTATPTLPPTALPTEEIPGVLVNGLLVHYADIQTGMDEVDQIIDVISSRNMDAFRQSIKYTALGCTHSMALGGPPECREGESEGTLVEALPFMGSEGHFLRKDDANNWQGINVVGLYTVYRASEEVYSTEEYPAGVYGVAFRTKDPNVIVTFQVENGRIVRVDSAFGTPPEINFEIDAQEIILPPPNVNAGCPGAAPQRISIDAAASVCTQSEDLILRSGPGLDGQALIGISTGTNFTILDGPACASNWFWWRIELDSGLEGWLAEGGDDVDPYFICPVP